VTIDELLAQIAQVRKQADPRTQDALAGFERQLKAFGAENERELAARDEQIAAQNAQLAEKDKLIEELKKQQETRVTRGTPTDIAKSFRAVIDEFHAETREAEDVGVAIKALDLEVKGLVEVDDQKTTLVLPTAGTAVDPTTLSTMRVSFATVPVVPAEAPPEPPPSPKARRRPRRS
jgi:ribosomal protein L9